MAAATATCDGDGTNASAAVNVNQACRIFGEKGDEGLAYNLQNEEYKKKTSWNQQDRRQARTDVPLARSVHDEEEERQQRQRLEFLQQQTRQAQQDAELARRFQSEENNSATDSERRRQEIEDQELARRLQQRDSTDHRQPSADAYSGFRLSSDGLTDEDRKQLLLMQDEELALALQEHEKMKAIRAEREFARAQSRGVAPHPQQQVVYLVPAPQYVVPTPQCVVYPPQYQPAFEHLAVAQQAQQAPARLAPSPPHHQQQQQQQQQQKPPRPPEPRPADDRVDGNQGRHNTQDTSGRSLTLVTSVGQSEFYSNVKNSENQRNQTMANDSRKIAPTSKNGGGKVKWANHAEPKDQKSHRQISAQQSQEGRKDKNNCKQQ